MLVPFDYLWIPALFVTFFGAWVLVKVVKLSFLNAFLLGVIKAAIPFFFFAYFYDGSWNLLDDMSYLMVGNKLMARAQNPFLSLFTQAGREQLIAISRDQTYLYYWWNYLAIYLFGPFYSSPIFLNVATTFVSAALMFKIVRASGYNEKYSKWLSIFFLLHWDILAWSSFVNLKDTLVLLLTLAAVYSGIRFVQTRKILWALALAGVLFIFLLIRFYIPLLMVISLVVWTVFVVKGFKKVPLIIIALAGVLFVFPEGAYQTFQEMNKEEWIYGPIQMALTPRPWAIDPGYSFLLIPSIFHWVFFIPGLVAGVLLFRKNPAFRFAAIYFVTLVVFFGLLPDIRGPRERLQITWVLAWVQFDYLWPFISSVMARRQAAAKIRMGHPVRKQIAQKI